jgi:hypothetical protein
VIVVAVSGFGALLGTTGGLVLILVTVGAVYLYGWKKPPDVSFETSTPAGRADDEWIPNRHGGPIYEADVPETELESVDHDVFDPVGTITLLAIYFVVIGLAWLFMYFVEFLGNGPTVVG